MAVGDLESNSILSINRTKVCRACGRSAGDQPIYCKSSRMVLWHLEA
jgi:hypothetical protein